MRLKRIDCPLMNGYKECRKCDDYHWQLRKLFPKNFQCHRNGKCIIREIHRGSIESELICKYREQCVFGDICPGSNKSVCTFSLLFKKEEEKKKNRKILLIPPSLKQKLSELL